MTDELKPRLLVLELRMLGDAVLSFPFLRAACERYEVFVCCPPASLDVYAMVLPRERLIPWNPPWLEAPGGYRRARLGGILRALRAVRARAAVSVWPDTRVHLLMALSGAPQRVGFPMTRDNYLAVERPWRARQLRAGRALAVLGSLALCRSLLTRRLRRERPDQPHLSSWQQLAAALALPWNDAAPWFVLPRPAGPGARQAADFAAAVRRTTARPVFLLHPGGRVPSKRWATERWQTVLDTALAPRGIPVVIVGPPEGPALTPRGPLQIRVATRDVPDLAAAVAAVDVLICHDSLPGHIGAALGKRVIALFGSGNPAWFAPFGSADLVVKADVCPCNPCMDRCLMPSILCLEAVTVPMVEDAIRRCL